MPAPDNVPHRLDEEELFHRAAELPTAARAAYLLAACEGRPSVRARVERLLASHEEVSFMQRSTERTDSAKISLELEYPKPKEKAERIGHYQLIEQIGQGGFGTVWLAEQAEPVRRQVALKIIKLGMDTKEVIARFEQERQALAMMDHPSVAKVFDAGVTPSGRPFFVMELVRGIRITDYCDQRQLSIAERLQLFIAVCHAIQHAHQKGIVHRDLKPSNILVAPQDGVSMPKVIDFGVAKAARSQRLTELTLATQIQQMIGTPLYMSPEQAGMSGLDVDTRSDIYSLGALLYELLTGQTPFAVADLMGSDLDMMRKTIREKEPARPSTKLAQRLKTQESKIQNPKRRIPQDLDWIVMKCLEKDRARRYETASALAADLERHLADEPVLARPPTQLYRFRKLARRNKLAFGAAGAVAAALLVGLVLAFWQARRAINAEQATRRNAYAAEINVAFHALAENNLGQARRLLDRQRPQPGEEDLRGFEWRYLWKLCQGDEFATLTDGGAQAAALSPDGKLFAYSGTNLIVREARSLKIVITLAERAETLSFAPNTPLLASGHLSTVKLWDTERWQEVRSLPDAMLPALFSPDGRWLLTGVKGGFRLWDTQTWQPVKDCPGAPRLLWQARNAIAFSPDSQFLVTVAGEYEIGDHLRVWRLPALEELSEFRFADRIGSVAFSPDGKHLVTGLWNGEVIVCNFVTREIVPTPKEHNAWVTVIAVPREGKVLATASSDRTINLWDATTFEHLVRLRGHVGQVSALAVAPDGSTLVSGCPSEGATKLWRTDTRHPDLVLEDFSFLAGFIGGGRQLVAAAAANGWCVWTPESGQRVRFPFPISPPIIGDLAQYPARPYDVKPDEPLGVLGRSDGTIEVWNLETGVKVTAWPGHRDGIGLISFSPDGKRLATGSIQNEVKIWDFATRQEVARFGPLNHLLLSLAFSPNGRILATSGESKRVRLWDAAAGNEVRQIIGRNTTLAFVAFDPQGALLATASFSDDLPLWEFSSGKLRTTLRGHVQSVTGVAFSSDGMTVATGGMDGKVKLWNLATYQELATFPMASSHPMLRFSPDGRTLALSFGSRAHPRIRILRAPSLEEIAAVEAKRN